MKRYEVRGMMEWHPVFRVGRGRLQVSFTGGHLSAGGCTPASFETSDPVVQKVIEGSGPFRRGLITMSGDGAEAGSAPGRALADGAFGAADAFGSAVGAGVLHDLEFGTLGEAQDFLQSTKGIPIDVMRTEETCRAVASQLGISLKLKNG